MCKFLTGKARAQQTDRKRMWKLLDNVLYKANNGKFYLAPRNMYTDFYTIPCWIAWIAGSPVDYDTRCAVVHDQGCYNHAMLIVNLTEKELRDKGYLRFSEKNNMWVCEDVPAEYLYTEKIGKFAVNNLLYECMKACDVPLWDRIKIRIGVCFNIGWWMDLLTHKVFELDLNRVYEESFWRENVPQRY